MDEYCYHLFSTIIHVNNLKYLQLANSTKPAIVDDDVFEVVSRWKWRLDIHGYVVRRLAPGKQPAWLKLHRYITNCPKGLTIDHKNLDKLDNRLENLRICKSCQNGRNRAPRRMFKGVRVNLLKKNPRHLAYITFNWDWLRIGRFESEHTAALAYDLWAVHLFGEFARTNYKVVLAGP